MSLVNKTSLAWEHYLGTEDLRHGQGPQGIGQCYWKCLRYLDRQEIKRLRQVAMLKWMY